jgi:hypothetical protein
MLRRGFIEAYGADPDKDRYLPLDEAEYDAARGYQMASAEVNSALWTGAASGSMEAALKIAGLDKIMTKARTPCRILVSRVVMFAHPLVPLAKALKVGDIYENLGFDSTSVNRDSFGPAANSGLTGGVVISYRLPKGSRGLFMPAIAYDAFPHEAELLLDRNQRWRVVDRQKLGEGSGILHLTVEPAGG